MSESSVMSSLMVSIHAANVRNPSVELDRLVRAVDRWPDLVRTQGAATIALEEAVANRLGKPAALFLPTGKMAQQIALRIHSDRRPGRRSVVAHPTNHLTLWEDGNYAALHGLHVRTTGDRYRLMTASDIKRACQPADVAAVLWELPQRERGGELPQWQDLREQLAVARDHDAATHLDGARVWQTPPFYGRDLHEICREFDSIYTSLYKDVGSPRGAILAGDKAFISSARQWRQRMGGTIDEAWPLILLALDGLEDIDEAMPRFVQHTQAIAAAILAETPALAQPPLPHTAMFHVYLPIAPDMAAAAQDSIADTGLPRLGLGFTPTSLPGWSRAELTVGEAQLSIAPSDVAETVNRLIRTIPTPQPNSGSINRRRHHEHV